ncbi:MAG: PAS-domain containing protein [Rhodospirillaceae bacterium]
MSRGRANELIAVGLPAAGVPSVAVGPVRLVSHDLETVFNSISQGIILCDSEGRLIRVNERYAEMFPLPPDLLQPGTSVTDIIWELDSSGFLGGEPGRDEVLRQRELIFSPQRSLSELMLANGDILEVETCPLPAGGIIISYTDITEHRRTDRVLAETHRELEKQAILLETTLDTISQGVVAFDDELCILVSNPRYQELLDLPDDLVSPGTHISEYFRFNAERGEYGPGDIDDLINEHMVQVLTFEPVAFERERPGGLWIEVRGAPMPGGGYLYTYNDITERKRAEQARSAWLASIERELSTAQRIQASILPRTFPSHPRVSGHGLMVPAREVGGDFYDYIVLDDDHIGVAIADVSGKGVPAAFFMAIARTLLRASALFNLSPGACLARLNDLLTAENDQGMFVTVFYGILDTATGEFVYANGGHNHPALVKADGSVSWLEGTGGMLIGMMDGIAFAEKRLRLDAGDLLFLFTDGVVESFNPAGVEFTAERLRQVLESRGRLSTRMATEAVLTAVKAFENGAAQADDITCVGVRYEAGGGH